MKPDQPMEGSGSSSWCLKVLQHLSSTGRNKDLCQIILSSHNIEDFVLQSSRLL